MIILALQEDFNLKDYVIITDATSDIPIETVKELGVEVIPMEFEMGGRSYRHFPDCRDMDLSDFYSRMRAGQMPTTTQINCTTYNSYFEPLLKEGKDILYICFSSGLSGTYQTCQIAINDLAEKYPQNKVVCVDSRSATLGEGLLVIATVQKKREGMPLAELARWVENSRFHVCHWFTVDDLNHLRRGGRISAVSAVAGSALGIKPILHIDNDGHLIPMAKVRGRKKSLDYLVDRMTKSCVCPKEQIAYIVHCDCLDGANYVASSVKERLHVKDVVINFVGPIIGTHTGPGMVGLIFFGTER
jgi:DegV family protein with EDD domain